VPIHLYFIVGAVTTAHSGFTPPSLPASGHYPINLDVCVREILLLVDYVLYSAIPLFASLFV